MKKIILLVILLILSILMILPSVTAIRISPDFIRIEFEPNFERSYTFHTEKADNVDIAIEGDLAEHVSVVEDNIAKDGTFIIKVKLPEEIKTPGKNLIFVGITEGGKGGGTVAGIASIRTPIDIRVPYPGSYAEISFHVSDLNINENAYFTVTINNLGKEDINNAKAVIDVLDNNENIVEILFTKEKIVKSRAQQSLEAFFDASKHTAGTYKAIAHVTYADKSKDLEAAFRIGALNVRIINYTKTFFKDEISKFDMEVESGWNSKIINIYGEVNVLNSTKAVSSFKTVSFGLEPWEKKLISTFWDNEGLGKGNYDIEIALFYDGQTTKLKGNIEIIEPQETPYKKYLTPMNLLVFVLVLLILINTIVLIKKRRKQK